MNPAHAATPHDISPEAAMDAMREHRGPILLDLDETLYLRNSTEDFIDSAWPRLPALLAMRLLDLLRPWRWTGGEPTRDLWRVQVIWVCFPWTRWYWRRRVVPLAAAFGNPRLLAALPTLRMPPIIVTAGFEPIVAPLLAALGLPSARIVASRLWTFADRRAGKLQVAVGALGGETVRSALMLTDSAQDLTLLDACARPLRAVWPEARHRDALCSVYLPGQYLTQVKRPGERYLVRGILQEDFAFWVLASIGLAAWPLLHLAGLGLLLVSFWAIYECGYVDNDRCAARFEAEPQLSQAFHRTPVATPRLMPWLWAAACGGAGIGLLRWPRPPTAGDGLAWGAVLLATWGWFRLYNRLDKGTRVWLFAGLQLARGAAFVAVVPVVPIGAVAVGAHVLARWVPYHAYRLVGKAWPEAPLQVIRLQFFVVLALLHASVAGLAALITGTALSLLVWNLYRARGEVAALWVAARRIDHPPALPPLP